MLGKLQHIGLQYIGVRAFDWFKSYLTNYKQHVSVNGMLSTSSVVDSGILKGSNLGSLLFLLYFNDLSKSSEALNIINFTDDTTVFFSHPTSDIVNDNIY